MRASWQSLALAMVAVGCDSGSKEVTGPGPGPGSVGSYRLEAPFTAYEGSQSDSAWGTYQLKVIATEGTLMLRADSSYEHRLRLEAYIDGQLAHRGPWSDRGLWRQQGDSLVFDSGFIQNLAFRGVREEAGLVLHQDVVGEGVIAAFPFSRQDD
jgi:hypothetical protein